MFVLNWPIVFVTTVSLYVMMLLCLPFSTVYATIFLFTLIAYWSRLPGVSIPAPISAPLYVADVVDIFSVIISLNISGMAGGIFSLFCNLAARFSGAYPEWGGYISDTLSQFVTCLILPLFTSLSGTDIFTAVIAYSVIRIVFVLIFDQIFYFYTVSLLRYMTEVVVGTILLLAVNIFYTKLFGNFINSLLQSGVAFSWILFLVATAIILVFYVSVFRYSKRTSFAPALHGLTRALARAFVTRKHDHKQMHGKDMDDIERIRKEI